MTETTDTGTSRLRTFRNRILKASEILAHELLSDIIAQKLKEGDRLPQESEMIARYSVARSTVREALRILEINGLITIRSGPGGGPTVCNATPADFGRMASFFLKSEGVTYGDVMEARRLLEPLMVRNATEKSDREFLAKVEDLKARSLSVDIGDDHRYVAITREFHELVNSTADNKLLSLLSHGMMAMFMMRVARGIFPEQERSSVIREHDQIMESILAGNAPEAQERMQLHMDRFVGRVHESQNDIIHEVVSHR